MNISSTPTFLQHRPIREEVYVLSDVKNEFETHYLALRSLEGWLISDDVLPLLPNTCDVNSNTHIWKLRKESVEKFTRYFSDKNAPEKILEIGCGNGWFSNKMKQLFPNAQVIGLDINFTELSQAARVFNSTGIYWVYGDIFENILPDQSFDLIVFNGSIQYFPDLKIILTKSLSLLKSEGSIHILDSPFYPAAEKENAEKRTRNYFASMNTGSMEDFYHVHTFEVLDEFSPKFMYQVSMWNKLKNTLLGKKTNPLPWIMIRS